MSLRDDIQAEAFALGFSLIGVTHAAPPMHFTAYRRWIEAGLHAGMEYLANEHNCSRRADLTRVLPGCRSLLMLGIGYPNPASLPEPLDDLARGRVAAYAWGEDYHNVLLPRLDQLAQRIASMLTPPPRWLAYTDTGAILERSLSQRAGLGWISKNTCLIAPGFGSYFFIAELLLDVEIEPDLPFSADRCGNCRRCLDACPTACILPDRTIDASRCISYLTIENRGDIALELRPKLGEWVFGCDVCQWVCPWNIRFAPAAGDPAFDPRPGLPRPILREDLLLTPSAFKRRFENTPLLRARRRGYLRNLAVAAGNLADDALTPVLAQVLAKEPEALVRAHAAWALGRLNNPASRQALQQARRSEPDSAVQTEILAALASA